MIDNKYSCEACGRHVDAVKQISIKSLPDNLIFHLKRFEYIFHAGKRTKVNDYFQFPREIDLFPYTMKHIEMQDQHIERPREETEIMYDLVGVLVHTGTAESGHYYSYIRDPRSRDSVPDPRTEWFEFNDSEVKPWRVEDLDHWCYGGPELNFDPTFYREPPPKSYSAYMLFYRKRPKATNGFEMQLNLKPPSQNLQLEVQRSNDLFTRRYVLYGDDLTAFVAKLLNTMPQNDTIRIEDLDSIDLDDQIGDLLPLTLGLQVYRRIVSRLEYRSSVEKYFTALKSAIVSSPAALHYFYNWLRRTPGCLRELLLSNVNDKARMLSAQLVAFSVTGEQVPKPRNYDEDNPFHQIDIHEASRLIIDVADLVYTAGDNNAWRTWSEYFETLALIARDPDWAKVLIEHDMIRNCMYHFMHTIFRTRTPPPRFGRLKYPDTERSRPRWKELIHFLSLLIPHVAVPDENPTGDRHFGASPEPGWVTDEEFEQIFAEADPEYPGGSRRNITNFFVTRMFETSCDPVDMSKIVQWMVWQCVTVGNMNSCKHSIVIDIYRAADPSQIYAAEALEVASKLFDMSVGDNEIGEKWKTILLHLVKRLGTWSDRLRESFYGQEWLSFWKLVFEYDEDDDEIHAHVLSKFPDIVAQLIYSNDSLVRDQTAEWVNTVLQEFSDFDPVPEEISNCLSKLYSKLAHYTDLFLERKFTIAERIPSVYSVVNPVISLMQLIVLSRHDTEDNQLKLSSIYLLFIPTDS
jgi:Ubiquitin carboxyl-terminal hydrolase/Domain of unknown function (DUF3517)